MNSPWPLHFSASRTRLTPGMLTMMSYRSLFLLAAFCWIGEVIWASVTRFGKILQLRPKCKNLWRTFQCLFSGRQSLETTLAKKHVWVIFHCCKWPNIKNNLAALSHWNVIVCLKLSKASHWSRFKDLDKWMCSISWAVKIFETSVTLYTGLLSAFQQKSD